MDGSDWYRLHQTEIDEVITKELETARIAHLFVPSVTVPEQTRVVSLDRYDYENEVVTDDTSVPILRFNETVEISKLQTDDPDATRAMTAIRRGTQRLARKHDHRVLREEIADKIEEANENSGEKAGGKDGTYSSFHPIVTVEVLDGSLGEGMVPAVAEAIGLLDGEGYSANYALVASNKIWTALHQRGETSTTLPIEAVKALLEGGPLRRSSVLDDDYGTALVMSLGEGRIDRVIAEAPRLVFVEQQENNRTFELYERYVPRFRETLSVVLLQVVQT
jgi:uncharacterized linocin/CFP29 family protein